ncbi:MAG: ribose transport system substrate-binding protein [bacterium]|jgi:ribose transport system substrate-binding protein
MRLNNFLKTIQLILIVALIAVFSGTAYAKKIKKKNIIIGFSNASVSNSWRKFLVANFWAEIAKHPEVAKAYYTDAKDRPYQQRKDIDNLVKKGIDVLIVFPTSKNAVNSSIDRAYAKGIPVIIIVGGVTTKKYTTFIETNNYDMGKSQAEWLVKALNYKGNIVMFSGLKNTGEAQARLQGARDVLKKHRIRILAHHYSDWNMKKAKKQMSVLVRRFPKIDGIWSDSGLMSWPALEVLKKNGRPLALSTGDQLNGYAKFLKRNNVKGFIYPFLSSLTRNAIKRGIQAVQGKKIPKYIKAPVKTYGPKKINSFARMNKSDYWWIGDDQMPKKYLPKL